MSTKLSQKLERINSSVSRIRQKVELPHAVIEDVATAIETLEVPTGSIAITENGTVDVASYAQAEVNVPGLVPTGSITITENGSVDVTNYAEAIVEVAGGSGGSMDIVNGQVDTEYFAKTGTIAPNTFVTTSLVTSTTGISITGTYNDIARLDDEHYVIVSHSSSKCYITVYKGTVQVAQTNISTYTSATYSVCTADDGTNIFVLVGTVGYECALYHFTFANNTLTQKVKHETESKGSYNYMSQKGIGYFKNVNGTHYCLVCTQYDDWPYVGVIASNGSTGSGGTLVGLHDNNNYTPVFGGFARISDSAALVCTTHAKNSNGTLDAGAYLLNISGTTVTKTALSGSVASEPSVLRINDSLIGVAHRNRDLGTVILDRYLINGNSVTYDGAQQIGSFGSASTYKISMDKISDDNFLIASTYNSKIQYIPCTISGSTITVGTPGELSQSASGLRKIIKTGVNGIQFLISSSIISGILQGLNFKVGVKYVSPATSTIHGITKTECTTTTAGEIWKL